MTNKLSLFYLGLCCGLEESQSGDSGRPTVFSDDGWQVQREYILSPVTLTRVLHGLIPFTHPETQRLSTRFDRTAEVQAQVIWMEGGANSYNFECTGHS